VSTNAYNIGLCWTNDFVEETSPTYTYALTQQLQYNSRNVTTLALIKRTPTLDTLLPIAPQLHILNLFGGDETPYESLHAVVSQAVKPWFDAFVGARGGGKDGDGKMGKLSYQRRVMALLSSWLVL
jgi:hypothetical protein